MLGDRKKQPQNRQVKRGENPLMSSCSSDLQVLQLCWVQVLQSPSKHRLSAREMGTSSLASAEQSWSGCRDSHALPLGAGCAAGRGVALLAEPMSSAEGPPASLHSSDSSGYFPKSSGDHGSVSLDGCLHFKRSELGEKKS